MSIAALPTRDKFKPAPISELGVAEPSDQELVERAQSGDLWAEEALFRRHVVKVSQVATRLLGRTPEADDVIQDSFVIALEQLPKLRDGAAFRPWLLRIVLHQAHRRYRKRRMLNRLGFVSNEDADTLSSQVRDDAQPELLLELKKLDGVLARLDTKERFAWILRNVEGYQLEEVADACECSLATVKRWIGKADERVRKHVRIQDSQDQDA
jgi:RNA polymerase sigma-70 factor (ECF subfamily)